MLQEKFFYAATVFSISQPGTGLQNITVFAREDYYVENVTGA